MACVDMPTLLALASTEPLGSVGRVVVIEATSETLLVTVGRLGQSLSHVLCVGYSPQYDGLPTPRNSLTRPLSGKDRPVPTAK